MKKILFVLDSLVMGGLEKSFVILCDNLDYSKYEVDVYFLNDDRTLLPKLNKNVNVYPFSPYYSMVYNYSIGKSLISLIKKRRFDLAFYRIIRFFKARFNNKNFTSFDWKYFKKTLLKIDKKYDVAVGYQEGCSDYFVAECVNADVKSVWIHTDVNQINMSMKLDTMAFEKADYICTVSQNSLNSLKLMFPKYEDKYRVFTLPALYDFDEIKRKSLEDAHIDKQSFSIVSVGTLFELKGFHLCVESLKKLVDDGYNVKWYVLGEGPYRGVIEENIKKFGMEDNFFLLGQQSNPYKFISACDICVQPSRYEGFPLCVYEEKMLNKAVVVSDIPSHIEMITDGVNGLIASRDSNSIYLAIKKALDNKDLLTEMASKPVNQFVTKEETVEKLEETFSKRN